MSEAADSLHVFYRFAVPGAIVATWLFLLLPSDLVRKLLATPDLGLITITAFLGITVIIGWLSYTTIYPFWKWILSLAIIARLKLYPKPEFLAAMKPILAQAKVEISPEHVWSYFLWTRQREAIIKRVKSLADYGHCLYLVSFTLIFFPLMLLLARVLFGPISTLSYLISLIIPAEPLEASLCEAGFLLLAIATGIYTLKMGRARITYAFDLQWIVFVENRADLVSLINTLAGEKATFSDGRKP